MGRQFLKYVAYLQVLGIILVVVGHSLHQYPGGAASTDFCQALYNFRMPLFTFVSGFLLAYTTFSGNRNVVATGPFFLKKFKRLMVPFIFILCVTFYFRARMSVIADDEIPLSLTAFIRSFFFADALSIPFFWFLQMSFTLICVTFVVLKITRKFKIPPYITYIALLLIFDGLFYSGVVTANFFSINMTVRFGAYFVLGAICCEYMHVIGRYLNFNSIGFFLICLTLWLSVYFLGRDYAVVYRVASLIAILMCVSLCKILESRKIGIFDHLVGTSYMIFLLSWFFNVAMQQVLSHYVDMPWPVYSILSLFFGVYGPWAIYKLMQRRQDRRYVKAAAKLLGQDLKPRT